MGYQSLVAIAIVALAACSRTTGEPGKTAAREITFNRDIAPILFDNCASCHRPIEPQAGLRLVRQGTSLRRSGSQGPEGDSESGPPAEADPICVAGAPFSVLDYDAVRRNARAIASAVQRRAM